MSITKKIIREKLKTALGLYSAYSSRDIGAVFFIAGLLAGVFFLSLWCASPFLLDMPKKIRIKND